MGLIEQSTGNAMNGMKVIAVVLVVAAIAALRLRQGHERELQQEAVKGARQSA
jgi:MFS-type transporter involved in bile tolerance (Atg22 family)